MTPPADQIQSVTKLTLAIKHHLTSRFQSVWVAGEVSGVTRASSGHIYFTLKDANAQINAIVWRSTAERTRFEIENGQEVICHGDLDLYPKRGTYQLIVGRLQPKGMGQLELAFRQLQEKLRKQGLFDPQYKKPLPRFPQRVAVVTSPSGAAIQDFLQVVNRRWPGLQITIVPTKVQGPGSAHQVAQGIRVCERMRPRPDVIVVTRGGGSLEDLWSFNEETVCRAIFEATIPVISGVGHEVDTTLSDLVADQRALTPSEAAELLVPDRNEVLAELNSVRQRMGSSLVSRVDRARAELDAICSRPVLSKPFDRLHGLAMELDGLERRIQNRFSKRLDRSKHELATLAARMESINPLAVLSRGYSLTSNRAGQLIADCGQVKPGDTISTRVSNGIIESTVDRADPIPD